MAVALAKLCCVARPLRIEYAGAIYHAIYHAMKRGNARRRIFPENAGRQHLLDGLEDTVVRYRWELLSFRTPCVANGRW